MSLPLIGSPLILLLVPLLLRLLPVWSDRDARWSTPIDVGLALGLGVVTALVKSYWLAASSMMEPTDTTAAIEVCTNVTALRDLAFYDALSRPAAGLVPAFLTIPLGFFDGMAAGALFGSALLGAALYLWGRALHGRTAGAVAAVMSCGFNTYVVMSRYLSSYPISAALFTLCAASAMVALRWRTLPALGFAGVGVGLALAADHPGLIYALAPFLIACFVAVKAPLRRVPLRLVVLFVPILLSWCANRVLVSPLTPTFEDKVMLFHQDNVGNSLQRIWDDAPEFEDDPLLAVKRWAYPYDLYRPSRMAKGLGYHWGHCGPLRMLKTMVAVTLIPGDEPTVAAKDKGQQFAFADIKRTEVHNEMMAATVTPWVAPGLLALLVVVVALRRRPLLLAGAVFLVIPYVIVLSGLSGTQVYPKYLMAPLTPVPVFLGVAWAAVALRRVGGRPDLPRWRVALTPLPSLLLLGLLVTAVAPSWLSPCAPWRMRAINDPSFHKAFDRAVRGDTSRTGNPMMDTPICTALFEGDFARGVPTTSRLIPRGREEHGMRCLAPPAASGARPGLDPSGRPLPPPVRSESGPSTTEPPPADVGTHP